MALNQIPFHTPNHSYISPEFNSQFHALRSGPAFQTSRNGNNDEGILPPEDLDFQDFMRRKEIYSLISMLGVGAMLLPVFALATWPMTFLSPNLLLAKGLTLLSVPVGVLAYGKRRRRRSLRDPRSLVIFQRMREGTTAVPAPANSTLIELEPEFPLNGTTLSTSVLSTQKTSSSTDGQEDTPEEPEQCFQRFTCEGLLKIFRFHRRDSRAVIRFKGQGWNKHQRRKELAKYALSKIKGQGQGHVVKETVPLPPKDLSDWFLKIEPKTTTKRPTTTTTSTQKTTVKTTTEEPAAPLKLMIAEALNFTTTTTTTETPSRNPNPCAVYKCSRMTFKT